MGRGTLKRSRLWSFVLFLGLLLGSVVVAYSQENAADEAEGRRGASPAQREMSSGAAATSADAADADSSVAAEGASAGGATAAEALDEETLVFAGDEGQNPEEAGASGTAISTFGVWDLLRMVLVLLMVVGAVYGVIALLRRRVTDEEDDADSPIRLLASKSLGANQELHAVMVGKQVLLVAGGDAGVQLITRVEDQETIDELVLAHSAGRPTRRRGATFGSVLLKGLGNLTVPGTAGDKSGKRGGADGDNGGFSVIRAQHDRVRNLR